MTLRASLIAALCVCGCLCGCGQASHELEGSLSTLVSLKYDTAELLHSDDEIALRFFQKRESGEDTTFKLSYKTSGVALQSKVPLQLEAMTPDGSGQRTSVSRDVLDDPRTTFPPVERGELTFDQAPDLSGPLEAGRKVTGNLHVTFVQCTDFGCGRTVFGNFEANLQ
ncbi:MAG: hypothetical protein ACJ790_03875 [Myxococcaceae bacterium]